MAPKKLNVTVKGHITGLNASQLREAQDILKNAFTPNIRISPLYPRDKNRPGYISFFTIWEPPDPYAPRQVQLTREAR